MYKLQLLSKLNKEKRTIEGPMSPILAANEFTKQMQTKYHCLVRINFDNNETHNYYEHISPCGRIKQELTGMDTLVYIRFYNNDVEAGMFIDEGIKICPVGLLFADEKDITVTPIYNKNQYEIKLSNDEIKEILVNSIIFANDFKKELEEFYYKPKTENYDIQG